MTLLTFAAGAMLGVAELQWHDLWQSESVTARIFWQLRVPRVLTAFCAGAGLASAGLIFQALFLNSLATPYTLGVSSGSACGAAAAIVLGGMASGATGMGVTLGAMTGAAAATALILAFSTTRLGTQRHVLLLAGVAVSFFFSSLLMLIQSLASFYQSFRIIRWLLGGIAVVGYGEAMALAVVSGCFWLVMLGLAPHLNLLLLGDDLAHARGLAVKTIKRLLLAGVSLLVAVIVSITGPIGFIGMVVPHVCRLGWGGDHRRLVWVVPLVGGLFLVWCDLVARLLMQPSGLPVGVMTSLIGAPFFFFLLISSNRHDRVL
ncbi:Iron ABC transporter permease [Acanthopleuribacter pedis]